MGVLRLTLVLGLLDSFGPLSMDLYLPQLPDLTRSLETSDALAQATMSVAMIGLGLGQLIAGPLSDRYGRKIPLVTGVALFAVLSVLCALAPSIQLLLVARFFQGLAGSAGVVISLAIARDLFHGVELSRMISLLALVTASAPIIAPVIGGQLARVMDWRGIFLVLAGVGLALLAVAIFGLQETHPAELRATETTTGSPLVHMGQALRDPLFTTILCAGALSGVAFFAYLSMSPFVLQNQFGLTPQLFSLFFAVNAICSLTGSQISRLLVSRLGPTRVYLTGQTLAGTVGLGLIIATLCAAPVWVVLTLLALFLGAAGLGGPNGTAIALSTQGKRAGTASALLGTSMFVMGGLLAPLISFFAGTSAITMTAVIAVGSGAALLLGLIVIRKLAPTHEPEPIETTVKQ